MEPKADEPDDLIPPLHYCGTRANVEENSDSLEEPKKPKKKTLKPKMKATKADEPDDLIPPLHYCGTRASVEGDSDSLEEEPKKPKKTFKPEKNQVSGPKEDEFILLLEKNEPARVKRQKTNGKWILHTAAGVEEGLFLFVLCSYFC